MGNVISLHKLSEEQSTVATATKHPLHSPLLPLSWLDQTWCIEEEDNVNPPLTIFDGRRPAAAEAVLVAA